MLRSTHACVGTLVLLLMTIESRGGQIAVQFQGTASESFSDPFGRPIPSGAPVSGRFVYESTSVATHPSEGCDCRGYRQQIVNGFTAEFGGVTLRADDYIVEVANDVEFGPDEVYDYLTVRWDSGASPLLALPLLVDGVPYSEGLFSASFNGFSDLFESPALPSELNLADFVFPSFFNPLGDYQPVVGDVDVLFDVESAAPTTHRGGDFNFDNVVNGTDLLKWQSVYSEAAGLSAWRASFAQMSGPAVESHAAIVPEPFGSWIAYAALLALEWRSRSRRTAYSIT